MLQVGDAFDGELEAERVKTTNEKFERWIRGAVFQSVDPSSADVDPICELLLGYALLLAGISQQCPELSLRAHPHEDRLGHRGTCVMVRTIVRIYQ